MLEPYTPYPEVDPVRLGQCSALFLVALRVCNSGLQLRFRVRCLGLFQPGFDESGCRASVSKLRMLALGLQDLRCVGP